MGFAFFDLDDTLVDTASALRSWAADFMREHRLGDGSDAAAAELAARREHAVSSWVEFAESLHGWYGITTDPRELYERIIVDYPARFTLDPAVAEGLTRLRADGWQLGIVTNGAARMQHAKIERVGLHAYVDMVLASESAGFDKPDVRIFEIAAGKLGVELGPGGWMVGDMFDKDITGGIAAGLRTIWLPHGVPQPADGPRPEHTAESVLEAIALIAASE